MSTLDFIKANGPNGISTEQGRSTHSGRSGRIFFLDEVPQLSRFRRWKLRMRKVYC